MAVSDRRYRKTEAQIEGAMIRLLNKLPLEAVSVALLIKEADINHSTFYLHYQSLDAVVGALEDRCVASLSPLSALIGEMDKNQFLKTLESLVSKNEDLFRAVLLYPTHRFDQKLSDLFLPSLGLREPPKNKKTQEDRFLLGNVLVSSLRNAYTVYYEGNARLDTQKFEEDLRSLLDCPTYTSFLSK